MNDHKYPELWIHNIQADTLVKALNIAGNTEEAAKIIGIAIRTAWRWKRIYNIKFNASTGEYYRHL